MQLSNFTGWLHRTRSADEELQRLVDEAKNLPAEKLARAIFRTTQLGPRYRLVVIGKCRTCGREAQSRPIRTGGHLTDVLQRFEPDPRTHRCPTLIERLGRLDRWT